MTLDEVEFPEFGKLARRYLDNKRVFISSCRAVNGYFADQVMGRTHCRSIVGPYTSIDFNDAAIIWASFYHLMFKTEPNRMTRKTLEKTLQRVVDAFAIRLNCCHRNKETGYELEPFKPKAHSRK